MKPMGSGVVAFGLVSVPVDIYTATESAASVSFRTLHAKCGTPVKQQYVCPSCAEPVPPDAQAKGFELGKVMLQFEPAEIKSLAEAGSGAIEVCESVPGDSIAPIWRAGGAYYLAPKAGGERAYALLVQAMRDTGRAAVARWASRGKQHVVALEPVEGLLGMSVLRYAPEVRATSEVTLKPVAAPSEAERGLAAQLLESIAAPSYDATRFVDTVQARVRAAIEAKASGGTATVEAPEPAAAIPDLMAALKASLESRAA